MRTTFLIAALAALPMHAHAQGFGADVDETAGGGMEEAAALYFAPPPTEAAEAAIDVDRLSDAGTVQLAIALGQVEEGLSACQDLRRQMQVLIGDDYGSYSVNPGWLRRYQACVVARSQEVRAMGAAIRARQTALISRIGEAEGEDEETAQDAMRAADLMARLSARQSDVKIEVAREGRRQRAFVEYYNTGEFPDALREEPRRPERQAPADEASDPTPPAQDDASSLPPEAVGGAILREGEAIEGSVPDDAPTRDTPADADGAPTSLRD